MEAIIKKGIYVAVISVLFFGVVSCNDTANIEEGTDSNPEKSYEVTLGFGLALEPIKTSGTQSKSVSLEHNFIKTGYDVTIKGNLVGYDMYLKNIDLSEPITLEVNGGITVSVNHPDLRETRLSEVAFFGLDEENVATDNGSGIVLVPLELVQGYIIVEGSSLVERFVSSLKIEREDAELNTIYYSYKGGEEMRIDVEFDIFNNSLSGKHINELGEGMLYEITFGDAIGSSAKLESEAEFEDFYLNPVRSYSEL